MLGGSEAQQKVLTSTPVKERITASLSKKGKTRKQLTFNQPTRPEPSPREGKSGDETPCLYCDEPYGESRAGDGWVMCIKCKKWAHEACAGVEEDDEDFVCELCD